MFERKLVFGGIYRPKKHYEIEKYVARSGCGYFSQRSGIWVPIYFTGTDIHEAGYFMIDTFQIPAYGTFENIVNTLIEYGKDGSAAFYACNSYCFNSRIRLTDDIFDRFDFVANLNDYREAVEDEANFYSAKDVLNVKLCRDHALAGIDIIKKDASINGWNFVESCCNNILDGLIFPQVEYSAEKADVMLHNFLKSYEGKYNVDRVNDTLEVYNALIAMKNKIKQFKAEYPNAFIYTPYEQSDEESM